MTAPTRRIMHKFRIDELSSVDRPAQEHARMAIMKSTTNEKRAPARLRSIKLDELSLVDRGANPHARVVLLKRDRQERDDMLIHKIANRELASFATFEEAVAAIAKVERIPRHEAMAKARGAFPTLLNAYQREGEQVAKAAAETEQQPRTVSRAEHLFQDRVDEIAKRDGIARHVALTKARQRFGDEFNAAYGSEA